MRTVTKLLFGLIIALSFSLQASAAITKKDFYGYWEIPEASGNTCYVIVKRNGNASCFWAGGKYDKIEKGSWSLVGERLIINWDGGYKYGLEKRDKDNIVRYQFTADQDPTGTTTDIAAGNRFNRKMVGSMKTEPNKDKEKDDKALGQDVSRPWNRKVMEKERSLARSPFSIKNEEKNYLGYWEIASSRALWGLVGNGTYYMNLDSMGNVTTAQKDWGEQHFGQLGLWHYENGEIQIKWPSGDKAILKGNKEQGYVLELFKPDDEFPDHPDTTKEIRKREDPQIKTFFNAAETNVISMLDYLGYWYEAGTDGKIDMSHHIEVERWGHCYRVDSPSGEKVKGNWIMSTDHMTMYWEDGKRSALELVGGNSLYLATWPANSPENALPTKKVPVDKRVPEEKIGEIKQH